MTPTVRHTGPRDTQSTPASHARTWGWVRVVRLGGESRQRTGASAGYEAAVNAWVPRERGWP